MGSGGHKVLNKFRLSTPIGELELCSCGFGVHALQLSRKVIPSEIEVMRSGNERPLVSTLKPENKSVDTVLMKTVAWLSCYFESLLSRNKLDAFDVDARLAALRPPICSLDHEDSEVSPFQRLVYTTLVQCCGLGKQISYGRLAQAMENAVCDGRPPRRVAPVAVGSALRRNEVMLLVPCHRVVPVFAKKASNSTSLTGTGAYGGVPDCPIKNWLLRRESYVFADQ
ncbi:hypothetical protein AAHC03_021048 [Spirometra sp. Aus1]